MDSIGAVKKPLLIAIASICLIADAIAGQQPSAKPILSQFAFIENKGQWDARVRFRLTSGQKTLWLTHTGIVFDNVRAKADESKPDEHSKARVPQFGPRSVPDNSARSAADRLVFVKISSMQTALLLSSRWMLSPATTTT